MISADDRFQEKTTPHIRRLAQQSDAIRTMYFFDPEHEDLPANRDVDLFYEKTLTPAKGLVSKYARRALMLLSYTCAANCRYCERQDRVGVGLDSEGRLNDDEIRAVSAALLERPQINEVILSGGDPLTHPKGLDLATELLGANPAIKVLRIHTRFPVQMPAKVDFDLLERIVGRAETFYFSLHIDHPDELTEDVEDVITRIRRLGYVMLCQSVFLRGINDSVETLERLFVRLFELGVRPYYIYHCQPIPTTMRFVMALEEEVAIMSTLRERISGLAFPQHVLELQHTSGKVIVPTNHWISDLSQVRDFTGNVQVVSERAMVVQGPAPMMPTKLLQING